MEIINKTPFPYLHFQKYGKKGEFFDVIALRQTFRLKTGGHYSDLNEQQFPLNMADRYYYSPETSSLIEETDLVQSRPCTNIHILGVAHPQNRTPTSQWRAGIRIQSFSKTWTLSGPRYWEFRNNKWELGDAIPVDGVPLRYEYAYGGDWTSQDGETHTVSENPIGMGFYPELAELDKKKRYPAPQIIQDVLKRPLDSLSIDTRQVSEGTGPISRWWTGRVEHAGTYEKDWPEKTFPFYPDDFDSQFFNSAHPSLRYPGYLMGDEIILLEGLLPESSRVVTALPNYRLQIILQDIEGEFFSFIPQLDTLTIDLDNRLISLVRRLVIPAHYPIEHAVIGVWVPSKTKGVCHGR
ncbi:hypothetical protein A3Q29_15655 [Providencia stuartii]|uniref:DUF2169 domain-containing protein n=1 Tax=Providencia stuartii TaxID=588 RepID=A0A1S1HXF2_PROST|nr:hypothetical protein A3Q29_15655 [Providencia stuartii]